MTRDKLTRRTFIRGAGGLGLLTAATPFLPLRSEAAPSEYPRRLLLLFQPNGTIPENWWPQGTEKSWTLGANLASLQPYQDQLIFLDGVYKYGQRYDQNGGPGNEHRKGITMLWTGSRNISTGGEDWSGGTSIDQSIAKVIGNDTPFRSIQLGVRAGESFYGNRMIYAGPAKPLAPEQNPVAAFNLLFAGVTEDPAAKEELERLQAQRRSVIDLAIGDLERTLDRVSKSDRLKLEAHLEGLRAMEKRLDYDGAMCTPPELEDGITGKLDTITSKAQIDNIVMAFSCDLTRVGSIQYGWANTLQSFNGSPHHDLSHRIADNHDKTAMAQMEVIDRWYAEQVAYLLERLSSIPEGDGTLLDNTLVVWSNEIANGVTYAKPGKTHLMGRTPFMLAGGGNFAFTTGRYLRYGQPADPNVTDPKSWELHHHRVLVSICQAFGLEVDTYGDLDQGSGPAPRL